MSGLNATLMIAYRDLLKFVRDPMRIISTFIFPLIFIVALGGGLQASLGGKISFNYLTFTFTGVLAQTLFQSASMGVISLIEDRQNDFAQELFVAPVSRYVIIIGKILGETGVALLQGGPDSLWPHLAYFFYLDRGAGDAASGVPALFYGRRIRRIGTGNATKPAVGPTSVYLHDVPAALPGRGCGTVEGAARLGECADVSYAAALWG